MKMLRFAVALLVLTLTAAAQNHDEDRQSPKTVRTTGTGEVKVVPDRAVVELGVEKEGPTAGAAKRAEDAVARKLLGSLYANGVDEKDIQTTYLSLQPEVRYEKKVRVNYFSAQQTMSVTVRDLSKLDQILESLIGAGGNQINSITYQTSEPRKYRDQARELAVKAAREKAEALAKALGQEIGKARLIDEVPELNSPTAGFASNAIFEGLRRRPAGPSTSAGQQTISATVVVAFDLN
ncbi:MAG TPA: SIMPL domain-containing protein [Candidatus Angelobacter sp.]|nr:SIMPL domain-containing protein [Candidatus Angelobacter sp.]